MEENKAVKLKWLGKTPIVETGVTWGIPWKEGELKRDEKLVLVSASNKNIPVQSWSTAYWPDGSIKWTAHAATFESVAEEEYLVSKQTTQISENVDLKNAISVKDAEEYIEIDTGKILCQINKKGSSIIRAIFRDNKMVCSDGKLICIREEENITSGYRCTKEEVFESQIFSVKVEQQGPIRCTVKIDGKHKLTMGDRAWVPFNLRLYFYVNQNSIKAVYTFMYDGNQNDDFIKGLGMNFKIPMQGALYNRHVRFGGDTGLFKESPKNLMTLRTQGKYEELYKKQVEGKYIGFDEEEDAKFIDLINDSAVWNDFRLVQNSADSYTIKKRTKEGCSYVKAVDGNRAKGIAYAGSENGGLAVCVKNFWEKHPSALEINNAATNEANLKLWFWSPYGEAMDLRHYDTDTHVPSSYEGYDEMRSTPYGVGNTSEFNIWCFDETPENSTLLRITENTSAPALLICEPEYYYNVHAFGAWSLVDKSNSIKALLEKTLEDGIEFYKKEIEERRWYGFWDFGDVMHSYDKVRHCWRYDIGGCAWQNTELVPNMWLWYMFLRTGREDIFRMAENMTRHTSEVDMYHFGEYSGLGSRHNVVHWGCGAKEARISMAALHRFYYYLTADERIGDIMDLVKDVDYTVGTLDPIRLYYPKDQYPTHARSGPDWMAFSSNWFTRWERFEDQSYRDKMFKGIEFFKNLPHKLLSGNAFGYDPKTSELFPMENTGGTHFMFCFGNSQIWIEIAQAIKDPEWENMLYELTEYYSLSKEEQKKISNGELPEKGYNWSAYPAALGAYTAFKTNNKELGKKVWEVLLLDSKKVWIETPFKVDKIDETEYVKAVQEVPYLQANSMSQWSLDIIMSLEYIDDLLPEEFTQSPVPTTHA